MQTKINSSPEPLLEEFSNRNSEEDISMHNVLFWSSCLNTHPWQHLTHFREFQVIRELLNTTLV